MFEAITQPIKKAVSSMFGGGNQNGQSGGPPAFNEELVGLVEKEFKRRQDERQPFELQWRLNLAFQDGNQYLDINTASMALEEMPVLYDWQEREVFNHIAPNIETRISKLKRVRSVLKVRPGTDDRTDLHSAKVSTHILRNNYNDQRIRDKQADELHWLETCGTVFRKHVWNPKLGRLIGKQRVENPDADGQNSETEIREGDSETIVVPPQEIYPDSSYRNGIEECKSIIHAKAYHVEDIMDIWGVDVAQEKAEVEKLQRNMTGMGGLGYGQGGFLFHTVKLEKHAIVKEYWELPTKKYPEGRLITVAGGKLLFAGPLPYQVGEDGSPGYPFSMLICLKRPGVFWGKTVLERLIPVQRRYNALKNRKAEYLNRCAIGQWVVERESIEDMDAFERDAGFPGQVHIYEQGHKPPDMVQNAPLPPTFEEEERSLLSLFSILSGVSEISRESAVPAGVKSGIAIDLLREQDDTRLSNTADNIERFNIQSGKIQLRLVKQFVQFPRTLHAIGKNNVAEVMDWTGSEIRSEDIIIDNMGALAESPAQKRQMVFDLLETGLLNDPETGQINAEMRSKVFEMIEIGEWESADDLNQLHLAKAERENRSLSQGQFMEAVDYDDHIIHLSRHNAFRLTVDYAELRAQFPVLENMFNEHVKMHLMFLQSQALSQAQIRAQLAAPEGGSQNAA